MKRQKLTRTKSQCLRNEKDMAEQVKIFWRHFNVITVQYTHQYSFNDALSNLDYASDNRDGNANSQIFYDYRKSQTKDCRT
jgi:hypothetical protein